MPIPKSSASFSCQYKANLSSTCRQTYSSLAGAHFDCEAARNFAAAAAYFGQGKNLGFGLSAGTVEPMVELSFGCLRILGSSGYRSCCRSVLVTNLFVG
jgi:hypothetical protein